jgi:hypothetical protein
MHAVKIARRGGIMKNLIVVAFVALLWSATAEAQSCPKCYAALEGWLFCGQTQYNGAATCTLDHPYLCRESGSCIGALGAECRVVCVHYRWADGSTLPEKSHWFVAAVTIERPRKIS